jgi:phosphoglucomutase
MFECLTGFKFIGELIKEHEENGNMHYIFGFEESYGYLAGIHARDKDGVVASMLIAEMAAYHKNNGKTLVDALDEIYAEYGYYFDCLETYVLKGKEGAEKIQSAMKAMRESGESLFDDLDVLLDYSKGIDGLPKENVLRFDFKDGSWAAARPSGTEPKLKLYFSVKGENRESAEKRKNDIQAVLAQKIYG